MASNMVASSTCARPRFLTASTAASSMARKPSASTSVFPAAVAPAFINADPYSGPEAPPTVDTRVMPTSFKMEPTSFPSIPGSFCSTA